MAAVRNFEELIVWQRARDLTLNVYSLLKVNKDYGFRDQIQRASVSIMNNIAEGFEYRTNKEFIRYLYISKGSCAEVRSMLYLAVRLGYISEQEQKRLSLSVIEISKLLTGLIRSL